MGKIGCWFGFHSYNIKEVCKYCGYPKSLEKYGDDEEKK